MTHVAPYQCHHCDKHFVQESRFLKHNCKQMQRKQDIKSIEGQAALCYYQLWLTTLNRKCHNVNAFLDSKYFYPLIKFAVFVKKVHITNIELYIKLMVDKQFMPTMWRSYEVYGLYLDQYHRKTPPLRSIEDSINTIMDIAEERNVDVSNVFDVISSTELIHMLQQKRLSPWLLLHSQKFMEFYQRISPDQQNILEHLINPAYWSKQFKTNLSTVKKVSTYVSELKI